jgi:hypothetical protein
VTRPAKVCRAGLVRFAAALGLVAALLYAPLTSELRLATLPHRVSFVSELSAGDQPSHAFFQATDIVSGALIVVLAYGLFLRLAPRRRVLNGVWPLAAFGMSTCGVGVLPLDCAPSADAACRRAEIAGSVSAIHQAHTVISVIGSVAVVVSMVTGGRLLRREPGLALAGWSGLAAAPVVGTLLAILAYLGVERHPAHKLAANLGVIQRAELMIVAAWLALLSVELWSAARAQLTELPR